MKMTKYLSLLLGILPTAPLCAQWELNEADGYRLIVVTDRPDALYARGDEIRFIVTLEKDGAPVSGDRVAWCVTKDTWDPKTEGQVAMRDGKAVLGGNVLHEPGFFQCMARYATPQGTELHAMAGAAVDPEQIAPSMPEPKDFMSYWKREIKKQAKIPMNIRVARVRYSEYTSGGKFEIDS